MSSSSGVQGSLPVSKHATTSEKKTDGLAIRKELNPLCAGSAERLCGAISIIVITISA